MTRALVAVFKSQAMAEVSRRNLSDPEAALALIDLAAHYASRANLPRTAAALAVTLADAEQVRKLCEAVPEGGAA
jgi:hypothetical protein